MRNLITLCVRCHRRGDCIVQTDHGKRIATKLSPLIVPQPCPTLLPHTLHTHHFLEPRSGQLMNCRPSRHNCAKRRVVVPSAALFREIASHDSAPICRPLPWSSQNPASATSGPFDVGRATGRPLDEETQYGIRQFSARSSNQKHKS
jgi:hypothetical protein